MCAYLVAYALFLDGGPWRRRLTALAPFVLVAVVWAAAYRALGFGVEHSTMYVDPVHDPLRFLGQVVTHAPLLLLGQWGLPESDISGLLSAAGSRVHWLWALLFLVVLSAALAPLVARRPLARFWALGMVLSVVPVCATFASDRLLMFVGLGAMGLLAQFLGGLKDAASWLPLSKAWRRLARVLVVILVAVHLVVAPLLFPFKTVVFRLIGGALTAHLSTLPSGPELENQTVVFVDSVPWIVDLLWQMHRREAGRPRPVRTLRFTPSGCATTLTRTDARTLVARPRGGYLRPWRGSAGPNSAEPTFSSEYLMRLFDLLPRDPDHPMTLGQTIELPAASIEITALTDDGRPAEATFRFHVPLDDPSLRWLRVTRNGCVPCAPPAIGETLSIPSILE